MKKFALIFMLTTMLVGSGAALANDVPPTYDSIREVASDVPPTYDSVRLASDVPPPYDSVKAVG